MKKSLALVMALGITASAQAANLFSDVPAGHWAYDAVAGLAANGVVDGYGTSFGGSNLLTRYEMAQIVAKAMAKGANCDKLAGEFADELEALGVKVSKLEKKVDNVKITGQIRFNYLSCDGDYLKTGVGSWRTCLFVKGKINDNWSYTGVLENEREIIGGSAGYDGLKTYRSYLNGRIGGVEVKAGFWNEYYICDTILDEYIDAIQVNYDVAGFSLLGLAGKYSSSAYGNHNWGTYDPYSGYDAIGSDSRLYIIGVGKSVGPVDLAFNYFKSEDGFGERNIYNINADWEFAKDFNLTARYMWTDNKVDSNEAKNGWYGEVDYKGADRAEAGSWGLRAFCFDQSVNVWISPTYYCAWFEENGGYRGWGFGGEYTLAKNIVLFTDYYDTKSKDGRGVDRTWYTEIFFYF